MVYLNIWGNRKPDKTTVSLYKKRGAAPGKGTAPLFYVLDAL
jgi:hypothetical protein